MNFPAQNHGPRKRGKTTVAGGMAGRCPRSLRRPAAFSGRGPSSPSHTDKPGRCALKPPARIQEFGGSRRLLARWLTGAVSPEADSTSLSTHPGALCGVRGLFRRLPLAKTITGIVAALTIATSAGADEFAPVLPKTAPLHPRAPICTTAESLRLLMKDFSGPEIPAPAGCKMVAMLLPIPAHVTPQETGYFEDGTWRWYYARVIHNQTGLQFYTPVKRVSLTDIHGESL